MNPFRYLFSSTVSPLIMGVLRSLCTEPESWTVETGLMSGSTMYCCRGLRVYYGNKGTFYGRVQVYAGDERHHTTRWENQLLAIQIEDRVIAPRRHQVTQSEPVEAETTPVNPVRAAFEALGRETS